MRLKDISAIVMQVSLCLCGLTLAVFGVDWFGSGVPHYAIFSAFIVTIPFLIISFIIFATIELNLDKAIVKVFYKTSLGKKVEKRQLEKLGFKYLKYDIVKFCKWDGLGLGEIINLDIEYAKVQDEAVYYARVISADRKFFDIGEIVTLRNYNIISKLEFTTENTTEMFNYINMRLKQNGVLKA